MTAVDVKSLLELSVALSQEKDYNKLLSLILRYAMEITGCDGGTIYLSSNGCLNFRIMKTLSMGVDKGENGEEIALPPVVLSETNVCSCAAILREIINVEDVHTCEKYDFSGPQLYDALTGYYTQSMIAAPMENHDGDIIGVLQLINALDSTGKVIPFPHSCEEVIKSLASLAGVSISNMNALLDIREMFESFVSAICTAVDQRTPYNACHTNNMARYGAKFIDYLNEEYASGRLGYHFSLEERTQFLLSVRLHDIGKLVTPTRIMNKETRLGDRLETVKARIGRIRLLNKIDYLEKRQTRGQYLARESEVTDGLRFIEEINLAGFLSEEKYKEALHWGMQTYHEEDGAIRPWLLPEELEQLTVRSGNLTKAERAIMEEHVVHTAELLGEMKLPKQYSKILEWTSKHHEYLDGSGYPHGLKAEDLPLEVRILTILDIFDALTARDRPYKPPMPIKKALFVLEDMAKAGKLDAGIVGLFRKSKAWD